MKYNINKVIDFLAELTGSEIRMFGHDIVSRHAENKYGGKFYASISRDLQSLLPNIEGLSERNIRYCKKFYILYSQVDRILPQVVAKSDGDSQKANLPQVVAELDERPSILEKLCAVPCGHHRLIMDKCQGDVQKSLFFVDKVIEDGWSRAVLLNFIDTNLYERQGAATSNFSQTLPAPDRDLAQESLVIHIGTKAEWVDKLSLAISLREDEDPRVEGEVERLINEIEWND